MGGAFYFIRYLDHNRRNLIAYVIYALLIIMSVYLINLYFFKNTRPAFFFFLMRATFFLKPIMIILLVHGMRQWIATIPQHNVKYVIGGYLFALGFLYSMLFGSVMNSELLLFLSYAMFLYLIGKSSAVLRSISFIMVSIGVIEITLRLFGRMHIVSYGDNWFDIFIGVRVAFGIVLTVLFAHDLKSYRQTQIPPEDKADIAVTRMKLISAMIIFLLMFRTAKVVMHQDISNVYNIHNLPQRIYYSQPASQIASLVSWMRDNTPKSSLFAVPPIDSNADFTFAQLRVAAERGFI